MMGVHQPQAELFSYQVNLDKRVRPDHPLRQVAALIDFCFVRAEVTLVYGYNGHVSVDPVILLKMMFLLFWDDLPSERELIAVIPERLDYLWFLGYGLDDPVPNHSVLSKARKCWGKAAFERFFTRTITQCVEAGLVDGRKLHVDSSLLQANASKDSVQRGSPELIAALKQAYQAQEIAGIQNIRILLKARPKRTSAAAALGATVVGVGFSGQRASFDAGAALGSSPDVVSWFLSQFNREALCIGQRN